MVLMRTMLMMLRRTMLMMLIRWMMLTIFMQTLSFPCCRRLACTTCVEEGGQVGRITLVRVLYFHHEDCNLPCSIHAP